MLKLKNVEYKLANFGPQNGHPQLVISFDEDDKPWDEKADDRYDMFSEFKKVILEKEYDKYYARAVNGKLETYLLFIGSEVLKSNNLKQWDDFYTRISSESLSIQKGLMASGDMTTNQLRPPFLIWSGKAEVFSGNESVYEYFNIPYVILEDDDYSQLALQQIMNHTYGKVYIDWKDAEKTKELIKTIRETYHDYKSTIISDIEHRKEAIEYCLENGFVYYTYL